MKFTDLTGEEWSLKLTLGVVESIEQELGLNLSDRAGIEDLFRDRKRFLQSLGIILADQLTARSIDLPTLKHRFDGDTLGEAGEALLESLVVFSQGRHAAKIGTALRNQIQRQRIEAMDRAAALIESGRAFPSGDTTLPESLASIPAGSPSDS